MFLLPLEKDNPTRSTPWMTYGLIALNTLIWLLTSFVDSAGQAADGYIFLTQDPGLLTAVSAMFLHAGFLHLAGNMLFLWMFGDNVEDTIGPLPFLLLYLLCGLGGTAMYWLFNQDVNAGVLGASGAVSGVLGMYLVMFRNAHVDLVLFFWRFELFTFHISAFAAFLVLLAEELLLSLLTTYTALGEFLHIAFWAHVGGVVSGILCAGLLVALGVHAKKPLKKLTIRRTRIADIWCPHCGRREAEQGYGNFVCGDCGTRYRIVPAKEPAETTPAPTPPPRKKSRRKR